jgi:hypothetical protein
VRLGTLAALIGDVALVPVLLLVVAPSILVAACVVGALLAAGAYRLSRVAAERGERPNR